MTTKKICLLGSIAVGKTSLVRRFVEGIFSDRYLTTIGVKIDKKQVKAGKTEVTFIIWDLAGEDEFASLQTSYLRAAAGYILVVDGTRPETLDKAIELQKKAQDVLGAAPFLLALNKADLTDEWNLPDGRLKDLRVQDWNVVETSAKSGSGVEELFTQLAGLVSD